LDLNTATNADAVHTLLFLREHLARAALGLAKPFVGENDELPSSDRSIAKALLM
jgi:hypothetical protein